MTLSRRSALGVIGGAAALPLASSVPAAPAAEPFRLRYCLSSAMYGTWPLAEILPEIAKTGCEVIDIWCRPHGDQREQIDAMGLEAFAGLMAEHKATLGLCTRYPLGPYRLREEMKIVKRLGGGMVLCGSTSEFGREPSGPAAREAVGKFLKKMKPHVAAAEELGVTIAIENHDRQLLYHPDAILAFAELNESRALGLAFAPHHLHKWVDRMPALIEALGPNLVFFYAQEHSPGIREKSPKHIEMMQMPGFGTLDYRPILAALRKISYRGFVEPFMHPVPRGIPVLPSVAEVTAAINFSRAHLDRCASAGH